MSKPVSLSALSEEFVEVTFRHEPVLATGVGIHDYDALLPDDSEAGVDARRRWLADFSARFSRTVAEEGVPSEMRVDRALLASRLAALRIELNETEARRRNPVRGPENALHGVFLLLSRTFAPLAERKEAILSRLMATPAYLEGVRFQLDEVPGALVEAAREVCAGAPAFVDDVVRALRRSYPGEAERIEHAGDRARLAFLDYRAFLERELAPRSGGPLGIGPGAFERKLREEHLLDLGAEEIEALGRRDLDAARSALAEEAARISSTRDWREQVEVAGRRHPEPSRLLEAYAAETARAQGFVRERRLAPAEVDALELIETPVYHRAIVPWSLYLPPAPFDEHPTGIFFVTPVDLARSRDQQELQLRGHAFARIPLIVVHEAYPGRHLQASWARRSRSRLRQLAANDLFAEGWALDSVEQMDEQGYFVDPATRLFRLRDLALRACRVIVDVTIHTGRATFEEAVDLMVREAMLDRSDAVREVRRAMLRPTQLLSYLVGKHQIDAIREEARRRLGPDFRLYEFNAALLGAGTLPPALVREEVLGSISAASGFTDGA